MDAFLGRLDMNGFEISSSKLLFVTILIVAYIFDTTDSGEIGLYQPNLFGGVPGFHIVNISSIFHCREFYFTVNTVLIYE